MDPIAQGLQVSVLGLIITFLALGVFILVMVVLQRLFPSPAEAVSVEAADEEAGLVAIEIADDSEEGAVVAAIAVALQVACASAGGQLGAALAEGRGAWWVARRSEARLGKVERRG